MGKGFLAKIKSPKLPPDMGPSSVPLGFIIVLSLIVAFSQGMDYFVRPDSTSFTLGVVEQKLPLDFWGLIFLTFAVFCLVGITFTIWPLAIIGHGVLSVTYAAFAVGIFWALALDWRGYGWNLGVIYACFTVFHALMADGCYDEWAREWRKAPLPVIADEKGM